jgi:4-amino-4-deoxy-L-arabinose transferase-like glycosyltransferase
MTIDAENGLEAAATKVTQDISAVQTAPVSGNVAMSVPRVFVAAFLIKVALLFLVLPAQGNLVGRRYTLGFADLYDVIGNNLAQGFGYRLEPDLGPTMVREPGYPFLLAGLFRIAGYHIETARVANLVLMMGIAFMMMRLARTVIRDEKAALVATLLFLFYPGTLISEARGGIEVLFIFLVLLFMLAIHRALEKQTASSYFVAGTALGLVVLVRSTPLLFPGFLLVYLLLNTTGVRDRLRITIRMAVLALGMTIVVSPWIIRNYLLVHQFIPTATVQGVTMQEGQYTCERLSWGHGFRELQAEAGIERNEFARALGIPFRGTYYQFFYSPEDESNFNRRLAQKSMRAYRDDPSLLAQCVAQNIFNFWFLGKTWQTTALNALIQVPLIVLASSGAYLLWKRRVLRHIGVMLVFALYMMLIHLPLIAHARHSIPVAPFMMMLVSVALMSIWRSGRRGDVTRRANF